MIELKPGGHDIVVTNQNRIEYIHLMADYRLNKQVCNSISIIMFSKLLCVKHDCACLFGAVTATELL